MATLSISGQLATAPSAPINLHAVGALDLAILNPLLTAEGRRTTGQLSLDARVGGTLRAPRISGAARLADATIEDFALGVHITDITGLVEAAGSTIRLTRLQGRAGPGTIECQRLGRYIGAMAAGRSGNHRPKRAPDG